MFAFLEMIFKIETKSVDEDALDIFRGLSILKIFPSNGFFFLTFDHLWDTGEKNLCRFVQLPSTLDNTCSGRS